MTGHKIGLKGYWSNPTAPMSLGCAGCPDLGRCGGQTIEGHGLDCLDYCCNQPSKCGIVCPRSRYYVDRVREVKGFDLQTPRAPLLTTPARVGFVPMVFHGSARASNLSSSAIAMPLYRFFDAFGESHFTNRTEIMRGFKVELGAELFLSGVAKDHEVEKWWKLESRGRLKAISNFKRIGIAMVTTPNFSLMVDRPRHDDMHSMKRIVLVYHELVCEGQAAALHVNGRTQRDFDNWINYIQVHPEVTHLAYEFTTGTRNPVRMEQHAQWLISIAKASDRRLGLVLRGGTRIIDRLSEYFNITFIDSSPFEKAQHRQAAFIDDDGHRRWTAHPTPPREPIDDLLADNVSISELWFRSILSKPAFAT